MASIELKAHKIYAHDVTAVRRSQPVDCDGEFMVLLGPFGLREIDDAAHDRRARDHHLAATS